MCLILDTAFNIVGQNDAHEAATLTKREDTVGRFLFRVFPDNPMERDAEGLTQVHASLLAVLRTRAPHKIDAVKYDIARPEGGYKVRYWSITNTPVLGEDGYVQWIINTAEDVTELVALRSQTTPLPRT